MIPYFNDSSTPDSRHSPSNELFDFSFPATSTSSPIHPRYRDISQASSSIVDALSGVLFDQIKPDYFAMLRAAAHANLPSSKLNRASKIIGECICQLLLDRVKAKTKEMIEQDHNLGTNSLRSLFIDQVEKTSLLKQGSGPISNFALPDHLADPYLIANWLMLNSAIGISTQTRYGFLYRANTPMRRWGEKNANSEFEMTFGGRSGSTSSFVADRLEPNQSEDLIGTIDSTHIDMRPASRLKWSTLLAFYDSISKSTGIQSDNEYSSLVSGLRSPEFTQQLNSALHQSRGSGRIIPSALEAVSTDNIRSRRILKNFQVIAYPIPLKNEELGRSFLIGAYVVLNRRGLGAIPGLEPSFVANNRIDEVSAHNALIHAYGAAYQHLLGSGKPPNMHYVRDGRTYSQLFFSQ